MKKLFAFTALAVAATHQATAEVALNLGTQVEQFAKTNLPILTYGIIILLAGALLMALYTIFFDSSDKIKSVLWKVVVGMLALGAFGALITYVKGYSFF